MCISYFWDDLLSLSPPQVLHHLPCSGVYDVFRDLEPYLLGLRFCRDPLLTPNTPGVCIFYFWDYSPSIQAQGHPKESRERSSESKNCRGHPQTQPSANWRLFWTGQSEKRTKLVMLFDRFGKFCCLVLRHILKYESRFCVLFWDPLFNESLGFAIKPPL